MIRLKIVTGTRSLFIVGTYGTLSLCKTPLGVLSLFRNPLQWPELLKEATKCVLDILRVESIEDVIQRP